MAANQGRPRQNNINRHTIHPYLVKSRNITFKYYVNKYYMLQTITLYGLVVAAPLLRKPNKNWARTNK